MQPYKFFISIIYDSYAPGLLCSMFSILCGVSKFITSNASFGTFSSIALTIQHLPSRQVPLCVQVFHELPLTISWFDKILACGSCDFIRKKAHIVVFSITVGTTSSRNVPSSKYNKVIFKHISFVFSMFIFLIFHFIGNIRKYKLRNSQHSRSQFFCGIIFTINLERENVHHYNSPAPR